MTQRPVVCIIRKKRSKGGEKPDRTEIKENRQGSKEHELLIQKVFGKTNAEELK